MGGHSTDDELMRAYVGGDAAAFDALYRRYEHRLFGFFARAFGDRSRAEDLLQQTFLNVHRARHRYRGDSFAAWVFAIVRNLYREECRRRSRKPETVLDTEPAIASHDPGDAIDAERELARVARALETLSEAQREGVVLCRFLELDYKEAATLAGCSPEAIKLRVFRGLRSLQAVLAAPASHYRGARTS